MRKSDGVYPSHVMPSGSRGRPVHRLDHVDGLGRSARPPGRASSWPRVVDKLAANVRGWQKVYDPDGDGLLAGRFALVDRHGVPAVVLLLLGLQGLRGFQSAGCAGEPRARRSDGLQLRERRAVAQIYRKLGQPAKAEEFDGLAARISAAVLAKMWRPEKEFFFSLRANDNAVADVKEVIGVYPFYFGMVPWGKGYERGMVVDHRSRAVLDEVAGGVGLAGVPGVFAEELAG